MYLSFPLSLNHQHVVNEMVVLLSLLSGLLVTQRLLDRGLTQREVDCITHRYKRRSKQLLTVEEVDATLVALDELQLLPGQLRHLLRSTPLPELKDMCQLHSGSGWCSYKKTLCDCGVAATYEQELSAPRILAIDCEFKPVRFVGVDEDGRIRFNCLIADGASSPRYHGILACDKPKIQVFELAQLQSHLLALEAAGCTFVAHTPMRDLDVLQIPDLPIVDVARLRLAPNEQTVSLRRLAKTHLGLSIQEGSQSHCAVQDARVTMALYQQFSRD